MKQLILGGVAALLLGACQPVSPPEKADTPPVPEDTLQTPDAAPTPQPAPAPTPEAAPKRAAIDWNAARADFADAQANNPNAIAQIASGGERPPVPVILPQMADIASVGEDLQFRPLNDGYYAVVRGQVYDMLINGTDRLAPSPPGAQALTDGAMRYEETMMGAQVAFKRYGASYLVEFACKDPQTPVKGSCVSEEDALAAVEAMLIAGTR